MKARLLALYLTLPLVLASRYADAQEPMESIANRTGLNPTVSVAPGADLHRFYRPTDPVQQLQLQRRFPNHKALKDRNAAAPTPGANKAKVTEATTKAKPAATLTTASKEKKTTVSTEKTTTSRIVPRF